MVRTERLELSHLAALEPKSSVSTNFTTSARYGNENARLGLAFSGIWGGRWESNPRHQEPQSCALPTELRPPYCICLLNLPDRQMAHPAGLEPATIRLEGGCSIQLSYGRVCGCNPLAGSEEPVRPFQVANHRTNPQLFARGCARQAGQILSLKNPPVNLFYENFQAHRSPLRICRPPAFAGQTPHARMAHLFH